MLNRLNDPCARESGCEELLGENFTLHHIHITKHALQPRSELAFALTCGFQLRRIIVNHVVGIFIEPAQHAVLGLHEWCQETITKRTTDRRRRFTPPLYSQKHTKLNDTPHAQRQTCATSSPPCFLAAARE